nr:B-cell receptor CD22-like [Oncorhynchus nerka]
MVTFTPSYLHHEKNITCTAVYPVGTSNKKAEHNMMLNVSFSPKDTLASISPADPVLVGSCVNLTCSSTANPPVTNFTWFKISGGKTTQLASGLSYTLNVTVDGGLYYCEARNSHGCGKSNEVQLAIKGGETRGSTMDLKGRTIHRDRTPRLGQCVLTRPQPERNQRNLQKTSLKRSNTVT